MTQQNAWHLLQIASFAGESFAGEPAPASHQSTCRSRLAGESLAGDFPKYDLRFHLDTRQRIRLASPIGARLVGVMYILDEPSIALHQRLLRTLNHLRDLGNTVVVIEHNLYVIKTAGWIIDPGPEGGTGGGAVVVTGTPQDVARHRDSWTSRFLKHASKAASPKQQHAAG